jgi:hypothetical protein
MARRPDQMSPISLYKAAWRHSTRAMKAAAIKERSTERPKLQVANLNHRSGEKVGRTIAELGDHVLGFLDNFRIPDEPTPEMKARLILHIIEGRFEAHGMMTKPDLGHAPQRIPPHLFKGAPKINWAENTIDNLGRRFEIVEVMRPTLGNTKLEIPNGSKVARLGRPRVDEEITLVALELNRDRQFDGKSEKEIVALTQTHCRLRYPKRFRKNSQPSPTKVRQILKRLNI